MAEAPQSVAPAQVAASVAPASETPELDAAIAAATEAANRQAAQGGTDAAAASKAPAPGADAQQQAPAEVSGSADDPSKSSGTGEEPEAPISRRGAAKQIESLTSQLTQAEQAKRELEARNAQRDAADRLVQERYAQLLGTPDERTKLDAIIANPATPFDQLQQARDRLNEIRTANEQLTPLYQAVEKTYLDRFAADFSKLRTLDGVDEAGHKSLLEATTGVEAMRRIHAIGYKAGAADVTALQEENKALRTQLEAGKTAPAAGGGLAPNPKALEGLIDSNGLPTDEAERRIMRGELVGVNLGGEK